MIAELRSGVRAVAAGNPAASALIERVSSDDPSRRMPPAEVSEPLSSAQIELLTHWVADGAPWSQHWSFTAPVRSELPFVRNTAWPTSPVDYFVLARLEAEGVDPANAADSETLLRRVTLDLTGLPPTPAEIDSFVNNPSATEYLRVVDRLLASPHYGERMARVWLDLARYADSSGYANDNLRSMWPYRDWVISSLNADMPFDQFTIEQLAGDLIPAATQSQVVASGFHRNTPHQYEGGSDPEQYRVERVKNRLDTTGTVWLGLTIGCAQCHTHKFDPIEQREYYQLYAFFNSADEVKQTVMTPADRATLAKLNGRLAALQVEARGFDPKQLPTELKGRIEAVTRSREQLLNSAPTSLVFRERSTPRVTYLQERGDFLSPVDKVVPATPGCLHRFEPPEQGVSDRLDLARWLMDPENPLTARVAVNRAWQHFFGRGLVGTENDFGHRGSPPTHPELLDWLAVDFVESGFSFKRLHRLIVTSACYQQSSRFRDDLAQRDPGNRLLARQSRHRVEGELIRDLALAASGLLSRKIGGPSVFPPIPPNVIGTSSARHKWPTSLGTDRYRRGLYTAIYRANVYPLLSTFDGPDRDNACTKRTRSNTPLQSLSLSNDPAMTELFRGLALRLLRQRPIDDRQRLARGFRICTGRTPTDDELVRLTSFVDHQRAHFSAHPDRARQLIGRDWPEGMAAAEGAVWFAVSRLLMNLDEFVTRE